MGEIRQYRARTGVWLSLPKEFKEEHLQCLKNIFRSKRWPGKVNILNVREYLMGKFPELDSKKAGQIISYWGRNFSQRHR